jgi:hypothetical protein
MYLTTPPDMVYAGPILFKMVPPKALLRMATEQRVVLTV